MQTLTVVMGQGELHGVDAAEVFGIEGMLAAWQGAEIDTEIAGQRRHHRIEQGDTGNKQLAAGLFQLAADGRIHQGGQNQTRIGLNAGDHPFDLARGTDQPPQMRGDVDGLELNQTGTGDGRNGFAGGVGHKM